MTICARVIIGFIAGLSAKESAIENKINNVEFEVGDIKNIFTCDSLFKDCDFKDLIEFNNASIRIFNLKGNLVYESHNIRSSHLEILDFNFENGVYIIEIQNGNKIEHFKLLKAS